MNIKRLQRKLKILDNLFWIGFYSKRWTGFINSCKIKTFNKAFIPEIAPIIEKHKEHRYNTGTIGNRVWVFWYTGFNSAPPIIRKCISEMQKIDDIDLVLLDKDNLCDYFIWAQAIKRKFEAGSITVTFLSDIIRNQLLMRFGGFWIDATVLFMDKDFLANKREVPFYSLKHSDYAACSHFSEGKWSSFFTGTCPGYILPSFATDVFEWYFENYDEIPAYFFIDYIYCIAYSSFKDFHDGVDNIKAEDYDIFKLGRDMKREYSDNEWNNIIENSNIQKLTWKIRGRIKDSGSTVYKRILGYGE